MTTSRVWAGRRVLAALLVGLIPPVAAAENPARSSDARGATIEQSLREAAMLQALHTSAHTTAEPSMTRLPEPMVPMDVDPTRLRLIVNGAPTAASIPRLFQEGEPVFALKPIAEQLFFSVVDRGGGRYELITPEGQKRTVSAVVVSGVPVLSETELEQVFAVEAELDSAHGALSLQRAGAPQAFQAYVAEKPPEQLMEEETVKEMAKKLQEPSAAALEEIPESAKPSLDVRVQEAYTYQRPHGGPPFRNLVSSVRGRVYDYQLDFIHARKDRNGIFDHDYTSLSLEKLGTSLRLFDQAINLNPLRLQSDGFNGIQFSKALGPPDRPRHLLSAAFGETENFASGSSGSTKYLGTLYQAGEKFRALDWLTLEGSVLHVENEADLPGRIGTTAIPRTNTVLFSGADINLSHDLTWQNHAAFSFYDPDDEPDVRLDDRDWRTALKWETDRYYSTLAYEFVGDQYASFGDPTSYRDYSGLTWFGSSRVTDWWRLSGSLLRYHNNVEHNPTAVTTETQNASLSSAFQITERQNLNLSVSEFLTKPYGGLNPGTSTRSGLYRVDYFWPFLFDSRLLTSYQYFQSLVQADNDSFSHTAGASLFKSYGRGSSLYASQNMAWNFLDGGSDSIEFTTTVNLDHHWSDRWSTYLNSAFSRTETDGERTTDLASGATGLRAHVLRDTDVNMEYSINSYNLKTEKDRWPRNWSVLCFVSQAVNVKSPPNFGKIDGRLFEDRNANGVFEAGEPAVADAVLKVDDVQEATTDQAGRFAFARIAPGRHHVEVDLSSVDPHLALKSPQQSLEVRKRRTTSLDFPMVQAGTISGHVFIDANGDRTFQETEEPLDGVAIIVLPADQSRRTDADGVFRFEGVYPGEHTVLIHHGDLPTGYQLTSPDAQSVTVKAGEEVGTVDFAVELLTAPSSEGR